MREMLNPTSAICGMGLGESVALITDGRFSGATKAISSFLLKIFGKRFKFPQSGRNSRPAGIEFDGYSSMRGEAFRRGPRDDAA